MEKINLSILELQTATGPPDSFLLLPLGEYPTEKGTFSIDQQQLLRVFQAFERRGNQLSIDYEHQSISGELRNGPTPAAGWIGLLEIRNDGLWATAVTWTETAKRLLENREYRYYSPTFYVDEDGLVFDIDSPALTNRPASHHLKPLVASQNAKEKNMPTEPHPNPQAPLLVALGLAQGASQDAAVARIGELRQAQTELLTLTNTQSINEAKGVLTAWKASHETLPTVEAEKAALVAQIDAGKREALIQEALSQGTLSPAQAAEDGFARVVPLETLEKYLETAPTVVNLSNATPPKNPNKVTLSQALADVANELGADAGSLSPTELVVRARAKFPHLKGETA